MRIVFVALSLLVSLGLGGPAEAQGLPAPVALEFRGGVLAHDVPGLWSGFRLEGGVDINAELLLRYGLPFLGGAIRPAIGASINTEGYTSRAYIDARWEVETPSGIFFGIGLGGAIHDGLLDPTDPDKKALGSRVLFHIPIEIGLRLDTRNSIRSISNTCRTLSSRTAMKGWTASACATATGSDAMGAAGNGEAPRRA